MFSVRHQMFFLTSGGIFDWIDSREKLFRFFKRERTFDALGE